MRASRSISSIRSRRVVMAAPFIQPKPPASESSSPERAQRPAKRTPPTPARLLPATSFPHSQAPLTGDVFPSQRGGALLIRIAQQTDPIFLVAESFMPDNGRPLMPTHRSPDRLDRIGSSSS